MGRRVYPAEVRGLASWALRVWLLVCGMSLVAPGCGSGEGGGPGGSGGQAGAAGRRAGPERRATRAAAPAAAWAPAGPRERRASPAPAVTPGPPAPPARRGPRARAERRAPQAARARAVRRAAPPAAAAVRQAEAAVRQEAAVRRGAPGAGGAAAAAAALAAARLATRARAGAHLTVARPTVRGTAATGERRTCRARPRPGPRARCFRSAIRSPRDTSRRAPTAATASSCFVKPGSAARTPPSSGRCRTGRPSRRQDVPAASTRGTAATRSPAGARRACRHRHRQRDRQPASAHRAADDREQRHQRQRRHLERTDAAGPAHRRNHHRAPSALVVIASIIPIANSGTNHACRRTTPRFPRSSVTRAAAGKHVVYLDNYAAFAANPNYADGADGRQPSPERGGLRRPQTALFAAISAVLP